MRPTTLSQLTLPFATPSAPRARSNCDQSLPLYGAHPVSDVVSIGSQVYISLFIFVAICRISSEAIPKAEDDIQAFFSEDELFLYTFASSLIFAAHPGLSSLLNKLETLFIKASRCKKNDKQLPKAITSVIQEKGNRFNSLILAGSMICAFLSIPLDDTTGKSLTYKNLELRGVEYTKRWILFVNFVAAGYLAKDIFLATEVLWQKYKMRASNITASSTCFTKNYNVALAANSH